MKTALVVNEGRFFRGEISKGDKEEMKQVSKLDGCNVNVIGRVLA